METSNCFFSLFRTEGAPSEDPLLEFGPLSGVASPKNELSDTRHSFHTRLEDDSHSERSGDLSNTSFLPKNLDRSKSASPKKKTATLKRNFEEEIASPFLKPQDPKVRPFRAKSKRKVIEPQKEVAIVTRFRSRFKKKVIVTRFNMRFTKEAKVLNKVNRVRLFWRGESHIIPNIFQLLSDLPDEKDFVFEFADFSKKEVLPDEVPNSETF